ncbi:MAG: ABC transporter substrate-binding protein, partial [Chloroflexota bacterium]
VAAARPAAGTPKYGGTLVRVAENFPDSLDPDHWRGAGWWAPVITPAYNGLLTLDGDLEIVADLAESWEAPDAQTYIFKMRKGAKWHNMEPVNGREFTVQDVLWNFKRKSADDRRMLRRDQFQLIKSADVVDGQSIKVVLKEPDSTFLTNMASPFNRMVAREVVEKHRDASKNLVGTGAFFLQSYRTDVSYNLVKNKDYWKKGLPYLDSIKVVIVPDPATRVAYFRSRQADMFSAVIGELQNLKKTNPDMGIARRPVDQNIFFMHPTKKPFDDIRVRQAFSLAIDRDKLIQVVLSGEGELSKSIYGLGPAWGLSQDDLKKLYKLDIARAKQLMAEAGYPNGLSVEVKASVRRPDSVESLTVVKDMLKAINVEIKPVVLEHTTIVAQRDAGDYVGLLHAGTPTLELTERITEYWSPTGRYYIKDAELGRMLTSMKQTADIAKLKQIARQFDQRMIDQSWALFLFNANSYLLYHPWVKGVKEPATQDAHLMEAVWLDK